ncbi:MAG: hypothetical protein K2X94_05245 [Amoebophilaceae bacterium]|nr:hypothetical protein [Amoebophilaceae bacterium]MBY0244588.1 hypothetical protein [Sphingobacteriaceae bacterium]
MNQKNFEFRPPRLDKDITSNIVADKDVRLNIVVSSTIMKTLKRIALEKDTTLKEIVTEQMIKYINDNKSK